MNETLSFFELDTRNPIHAAAYLKAASFFLSGWPQEWDAETLAMALLDEESPNQSKVILWDAINNRTYALDDPHLESEQMISDLAEAFVNFLEENK
jgi:hypothetical protein